jgi:DNA-binding NarL/FixJ family response regulator
MGVNGEKTAVILDRHPLWLEALERLLDGVGVSVVGKTTSAGEALNLVEESDPDVFIIEDDSLGQLPDGLSALQRVAQSRPEVRSVVLSSHDDSAHINAAFEAGASVYCVKTAAPEDLAAAIRQAFQSSIFFAGSEGRKDKLSEAPPEPENSPGLTRREIEILQMVAEGYSNSQLAKMLWVTEQTVKFHLSNIYRKLDVANRTEASRWAQVHGLLPPVPRAASAAA